MFLVEDTRMTLTEAVLVSCLLLILGKFCFLGYFQKIILFKRSRILEEIYGAGPSW